jgi:N-glycosylase/DNA lyase
MFRWTRDSDGAYCGVVGARRLRLAQSADGTILYFEADGPDAGAAVRRLLRLDDVDLPQLAKQWSEIDTPFANAWQRQSGVRLLRQDPEECFFSFLCASVAPIRRISSMLKAVASECGTDLGQGWTAFPTAAQLGTVREERLRELGLGFRARRVAEAANRLQEMPHDWLITMRDQSHETVREVLCRTFFGMGWKIADCICLFSLDKDDAIPVDTHIWRLAQQHYTPDLVQKSLTPANYNRVTAAFRERFGTKAGWAQQLLFYRSAIRTRPER